MKKPERNLPCPCGSEIKYKKCCGNPAKDNEPFKVVEVKKLTPEMKQFIDKSQAKEQLRKEQQGLGKPIISTNFRDYKVVAVGNRLHFSKAWKTFPDFLFYFLPNVLGTKWVSEENKKPLEERHPVLKWHRTIAERSAANEKRGVTYVEMYGAASCYLGLSYSLYLLNHNVELQERYVKRLKDVNNFQGTYYELTVANCLIRAGFKLELEDEADPTSKHCEFSALSLTTNKKYWVEAKSRSVSGILGKTSSNGTTSKDATSSLSRHVQEALGKPASGERIIFVDVNAPNSQSNPPEWCERAGRKLDKKEKDLKTGESAYVFVTNLNFHYNLETTKCEKSLLAYGLGISDFAKVGHTTLIQMYKDKQKHTDAHNILESYKEYGKLPNTFDGGLPSEQFGDSPSRIEIGETYFFEDIGAEGIVAKVLTATVHEAQKQMILGTDKGMFMRPITEYQLVDYQNHKEVYFGKFQHQGGRAGTPYELFEFFLQSYKNSTKEQLIKFLEGSPDIEKLKEQNQEELALNYCERLVSAQIARGAFRVKNQ